MRQDTIAWRKSQVIRWKLQHMILIFVNSLQCVGELEKMKVMDLNGFDISNQPTSHCPWHLLYLTCTPALSNAWPRDFPIGMPFLPMGIPFGPLPFPFICKPTAAGATAGTAASVFNLRRGQTCVFPKTKLAGKFKPTVEQMTPMRHFLQTVVWTIQAYFVSPFFEGTLVENTFKLLTLLADTVMAGSPETTDGKLSQ